MPWRSKHVTRACIAAAIVASASTVAAADRLTVTAMTGPWEVAQKSCVIEPFSKAENISIAVEAGVSSVTFAKLRQQRGNPAIDVAWMNGGNSEQAWDEGLLDRIEPAAVPNLTNIADPAVYRMANGDIYAVGTGYFSYALVYNPKLVAEAPKSWFDLWNPKYANRVYAPSPAQALHAPLLMHLNKHLGGSGEDFDPILRKFKELNVSSYYESTGVIQASIQSGEVVMGVYYPNSAWELFDQGLPIAVAFPKEGVPAADGRLHIVKGTKNKAIAEKFIDFAMRAESLNCMAEKLFVGPPLKSPTLSQKATSRMPWGAGGIGDLVLPDWRSVNAKRQELTNLWNRRVLGR